MTGVVYKLIQMRGIGFIKDEEGRERFMHISDCVPRGLFETLQEGQTVEFRPTETPKGLRAMEIRRCGS